MHKRFGGRGCDELIINFTWSCYCFSIINAHFTITECDIASTAVFFSGLYIAHVGVLLVGMCVTLCNNTGISFSNVI